MKKMERIRRLHSRVILTPAGVTEEKVTLWIAKNNPISVIKVKDLYLDGETVRGLKASEDAGLYFTVSETGGYILAPVDDMVECTRAFVLIFTYTDED